MNQYNDRGHSSSITSALGKIFSLEKLNQEPTPEELERQRILEEEVYMQRREEDMWHLFQIYTSLSKHDAETKRWSDIEIESQELATIVRKIKAWSPECPYGLFLHGDPGPGKTHMIKALIIDHYSESQRFKFVSVREAMKRLKNFETADEYREELYEPFGLVLDDLGTEQATPYEQGELFSVLDRRMRSGKYVFVTSNLGVKELQELYSPRIVSRLGEMMVFIDVKAPSYRKVIYINNQADLERRAMLAGSEG